MYSKICKDVQNYSKGSPNVPEYSIMFHRSLGSNDILVSSESMFLGSLYLIGVLVSFKLCPIDPLSLIRVSKALTHLKVGRQRSFSRQFSFSLYLLICRDMDVLL